MLCYIIVGTSQCLPRVLSTTMAPQLNALIFMKYFMSKHDIWQDHPGGMSELKSSLIWVVVVLKIPIHLQKLWKNRKKNTENMKKHIYLIFWEKSFNNLLFGDAF